MPDHQIERLLDEIYELRITAREIAQKLSRIESIVKRTFQDAVAPRELTAKRDKQSLGDPPTINREQALAHFDEVRDIVAMSGIDSGINKLDTLSLTNLAFLARELGASVGKSKPSRRNLTNEILGRVRQSLMLREHTPVHAKGDDND